MPSIISKYEPSQNEQLTKHLQLPPLNGANPPPEDLETEPTESELEREDEEAERKFNLRYCMQSSAIRFYNEQHILDLKKGVEKKSPTKVHFDELVDVSIFEAKHPAKRIINLDFTLVDVVELNLTKRTPALFTKAEKFEHALKDCLSNKKTFNAFYRACIDYLTTNDASFNEHRLNNDAIVKYILACAAQIELDCPDPQRPLNPYHPFIKTIQSRLNRSRYLIEKYAEIHLAKTQRARQMQVNAAVPSAPDSKTSVSPAVSLPSLACGSAVNLAKLLHHQKTHQPDPQPVQDVKTSDPLFRDMPAQVDTKAEEPATTELPDIYMSV